MSAAKAIPARARWESLSTRLDLRTRAFIGGRFVDAASGQTFDDVSPRDGRVIAKVAAGDAEASEVTTPFGGMKHSGTGRDRSLQAFEQYTHLKTTWIDLS